MKTADDSEKPEKPLNRFARALIWCHHHALLSVAIWIFSIIITDLLISPTFPGAIWIFLGFTIVGLAFIFAPALGMAAHHRILICDWCHSHMPPDPKSAAENERRRWLKIDHSFHLRPFRYMFWFCLLIMIGATWIISKDSPWLVLRDIPMATYILITATSGKWHYRLRPWCPFCDRRRWDDEDHSHTPPPPDPTPEETPTPDLTKIKVS